MDKYVSSDIFQVVANNILQEMKGKKGDGLIQKLAAYREDEIAHHSPALEELKREYKESFGSGAINKQASTTFSTLSPSVSSVPLAVHTNEDSYRTNSLSGIKGTLLKKQGSDVAQKELRDKVYEYLKENYPEDTLAWVKDATWTKKKIPLADITMARRPGGRDLPKTERIAQAFREGKPMEPVVLVKIGNTHKIADGYHRTLGAEKAGEKEISAYVATGTADNGPWDKEMHDKKLNHGPTAPQMKKESSEIANEWRRDFLHHLKKKAAAPEKTDLKPSFSSKEKPPSTNRSYLLSCVGKKQDKNGWYVHTHRARSKSYPSIDDVPLKVLQFIASTG